jgi:hypothetical protein
VRGDIYYLKILACNLSGNAIKYNHPGGRVSISARQENDRVVLEIADTGIGIPEDFFPHLFEEFCRVKSKETLNIPGTGLGLVISKRIVTQLRGSIEARSLSEYWEVSRSEHRRACGAPDGGRCRAARRRRYRCASSRSANAADAPVRAIPPNTLTD